MRWDRYKRRVWEKLSTLHADARVAGCLRAMALVGIVGGFSGFMIGLNPLVIPFVIERYGLSGDVLARIGIAGLLVHIVSMVYYHATSPVVRDDGLLRY